VQRQTRIGLIVELLIRLLIAAIEMALLFEFCFYVGAVLALVAIFWLLKTLVHGEFRKCLKPGVLLLIAVALLVGPAIISRNMAVDLGPRETIVNNERHISLTGWDGESYTFLSEKPDAIVLQMANADVTDSTLDLLSEMTELRELDLNDSQITDAGLRKICQLPALKTLRLRATKITDDGFREHLLPLPELRQLDLRETQVSTESIDEWKAAVDGRRALQ